MRNRSDNCIRSSSTRSRTRNFFLSRVEWRDYYEDLKTIVGRYSLRLRGYKEDYRIPKSSRRKDRK
jgi:hypothetical protein